MVKTGFFIDTTIYDAILKMILAPESMAESQNGNRIFSYILAVLNSLIKSSSDVETIIANPAIITATKAAPIVINIELRLKITSLDIDRYPLANASKVANIMAYIKSNARIIRLTPPNRLSIGKKRVSL